MSLLYNVLFAWKTKSTHHKLAMDALRHLQSPYADQWSNLFLKNIEPYLKGSKAPDTDFKDFRNHVLHVNDNYWGGAIKTSLKWYKITVEHLREENWKEAIYSAGVLSHYYTDPIQPFHTAQSKQETKIHRSAEWSIAKSYEILQNILEEDLGGYPDVKVPEGANWLSVMVKEGAETSNLHYDYLVENYDLKKGRRRPPEGLDDGSRTRLASLIGYASVGFARILDKAFKEADIIPPRTSIGVHGVLASMTIPIFWVTKQMADSKEKAIVTAIYNEIQETGELVENLPEDDREVSDLYEKEVFNKGKSVTTEAKSASVKPTAIKPKPSPEISAQEKPIVKKSKPVPVKPLTVKSKQSVNQTKVTPVKPVATQAKASPVIKKTTPITKEIKPVPKPASKPEIEPISETVLKVTETTDRPLDRFFNKTTVNTDTVNTDTVNTDTVNTDTVNTDTVNTDTEKEITTYESVTQQKEKRQKEASKSVEVARSKPKIKKSPAPSPVRKPEIKELVQEEIYSVKKESSPEEKSVPITAESKLLKFYLSPEEPVVDAPSIGSKTAKRLKKMKILTVTDLLKANPEEVAKKMNVWHIKPETIREWQAQADLQCRIPFLRGHDVQILIGCAMTTPEAVTKHSPEELLDIITPFVESSEGQRILRSGKEPDLEEVTNWINWSKQARPLNKAA